MVLGKPVTKAMISWFIENQKIVKPRAKTETFFLVGSWFGQNILVPVDQLSPIYTIVKLLLGLG